MEQSASERFHELALVREPYLYRARELAQLTLPGLYPLNGQSTSRNLTGDWNSTGARGVVELSGKMATSLLPSGAPSFQFTVVLPPEVRNDRSGRGQQRIAAILQALADAERDVAEQIDRSGIRRHLPHMMQLVTVGGNALIDYLGDKPRVRSLPNFVWVRDSRLLYTEFLTVDLVDVRGLESEAARSLARRLTGVRKGETKYDTLRVHVYTWARLGQDRKWKVETHIGPIAQDETLSYDYFLRENVCKSERVPGSTLTLGEDAPFPFLPITAQDYDGEPYSHAPAELVHGDLNTVSGLTEDIVAATSLAAETRFGVRPGGRVKIEQLEQTPLGGFFMGDPDDVWVFSAREKLPDLNFALGVLSEAQTRLERFFLSDFALRRSGERVTATEILELAQSLQRGQTGFYSGMAETFQRPLVERTVRAMVQDGRFPEVLLDDELVQLEIVTGIDAIVGTQAAQSLRAALSAAMEMGIGQAVVDRLNVEALARELFRRYGVDDRKFLVPEEVFQERARAVRATAIENEVIPDVVRAQAQNAATGA